MHDVTNTEVGTQASFKPPFPPSASGGWFELHFPSPASHGLLCFEEANWSHCWKPFELESFFFNYLTNVNVGFKLANCCSIIIGSNLLYLDGLVQLCVCIYNGLDYVYSNRYYATVIFFFSVSWSIDLHGKYITLSNHRRCLRDWMGVFRDRGIDLISQHSYLEDSAKIGRLNFIVIVPLGSAVYLIAKHLKYYMLQFDLNRLFYIGYNFCCPKESGYC